MKKSVGLVVMVKIPQTDGSAILMAVLQRRGRFNTEKMTPESYPGCCQVTCHGKLIGEEKPSEGLFREAREELGMTFINMVQDRIRPEILTTVANQEKEVTTFGVLVPHEWLTNIHWGPDSGGSDPISAQDLADLMEIIPEMKVGGPKLSSTRALFKDEIEAIKKAFGVFGQAE